LSTFHDYSSKFKMANGHGGARPGAGRKRKVEELELHGLLSEAWPMDRRRAAIANLADLAESDSRSAVEAGKVLMAYAYGKPIERKEISGPDGEPLKAYVTVSPDEWDSTPDQTD
jgi:hypothetical protein